eukprot:NODE_350_length_8989_cov_0.477684.p2 type:complete len:436 gc:universal NODE_350_length_8989_cov_0.477684:6822-5515(-)
MLFHLVLLSISLDCPKLVDFAYYLNVNIISPSIFTSLQGDCCISTGITCLNGNVDIIRWPSTTFTRPLDGYLNGSCIPPNLRQLNLNTNQIKGELPKLPDTLTALVLSDNRLTGPLQWPDSLQFILLMGNAFSGNLPRFPKSLIHIKLNSIKVNGTLSSFPNTTQVIDIEASQLTGIIPDLPNSMTILKIMHSQLTGPIPIMPPNLIQFDLTYSNLNATFFPPFPNSLTGFSIQGSRVSASLPDKFSNSLVDLYLNNNLLTGMIPSSCFPSSLTTLRMNDNFLSGTVNISSSIKILRIENNLVDQLIISDPSQLTDCNAQNNHLSYLPIYANYSKCIFGSFYTPPLTTTTANLINSTTRLLTISTPGTSITLDSLLATQDTEMTGESTFAVTLPESVRITESSMNITGSSSELSMVNSPASLDSPIIVSNTFLFS